MRPRHHAVIGDGATAAELAGTARLRAGDRLTLIGPGGLGRGLAYRDPGAVPWRDAFLLNSPAEAVDPGFPAWLAARWGEVAARMAGQRPDWLGFDAPAIRAGDCGALFLPRAIYGDYLEERTGTMLRALEARGVTVERRAEMAVGLERIGTGFRIGLAGGGAVEADSIDVAPGGPGPRTFGDGTGVFPTPYGHEAEIAKRMWPGREIVCIGANAAMLDVLRLAQTVLDDADIRLAAITPTGLLPEPLIPLRPRALPPVPDLGGPYRTAEALLQALDREVARARAQGAGIMALRKGFKSAIATRGLEALLPPLKERRKIGDRIERRFRRGTWNSIADLHRLRLAGQVRLIAGRVDEAVCRKGGGAEIRLTGAGARTLSAPLAVNCTGMTGPFDPLTRDLIARGWLRSGPAGLRVGPGLEAEVAGLRYLSPAVAEVGERVLPFPLYDMADLRALVRQANGAV